VYRAPLVALAKLGRMVVAPSITVADEWSIEHAAQTAAEAMAGLDAAPAPVVGHSFGGVVGAQLAIDHPDFVRALVAINAPLVSPGRGYLRKILLPGRHYRIAGHGPAAAALVRAATTPGGLPSLVRSARWFLGKSQEEALRTLAEKDVPRAIVWAERDTLLPMEIGVRAAELLACKLHLIGGDTGWTGKQPPDHDWPLRGAAHFAETIVRIVDSLTGSSGREPEAPPEHAAES
jgi:pimeloyl-ACP methyl ester carboxylesterase